MQRANAAPCPRQIAGRSAGSTIRRNVVAFEAPSEEAASSTSGSSSSSTGCTERTANGSVTNSSATAMIVRVSERCDPDRAVGPVQAQQRQAGDDRRQRKRQVDDRVDSRLPGNWSRTRTQATSVPITEPTAATIADSSSVCSIAFSASGFVNEVQNAVQPGPQR